MSARSAELEKLLALGAVALPLSQSELQRTEACGQLAPQELDRLFAATRFPQTASAGLLLRLGCWQDSHALAQDISTPEGSYWHRILHRIEPDSFNAQYWFRRLGDHPIFPELLDRASDLLQSGPAHWKLSSRWDPVRFVHWCDEARESGGELQQRAAAIQMAEWQLLFDWCSQPA